MKAIVCPEYGPPEVLQLREVDKPVPKDNELLIRVFTVYVGIEDVIQRKGRPYFGRFFVGLIKPAKPVLGTEFAGEIEAVGKNVRLFEKGTEVFGVTGAEYGCYAEYLCMPETGLVSVKPPEISSQEAAPICSSLAAWNLLKKIAKIHCGQKVLIYGASGGTGLAAIQIAKIYGAEVTGICSSSSHELVKSLGADHVIDIIKGDFTRNGLKYNVILNVSGRPLFFRIKNSLTQRGIYLTTYPTISILFLAFLTSLFDGKKVVFSATAFKPVPDRLEFLKELLVLLKGGKLKTIIDRSFRLDQMIEAHRYIEKEYDKGNVVVNI